MPSSNAPTAHDMPVVDPQRLDCYQVALEFCPLAAHLIPRGHRELRDQLTRASLLIPLNLAESCGRRSPAERAHFLTIARGSTMECVAIVDCARSLGLAPVAKAKEAGWLLVRLAQMLTRLIVSVERRAG